MMLKRKALVLLFSALVPTWAIAQSPGLVYPVPPAFPLINKASPEGSTQTASPPPSSPSSSPSASTQPVKPAVVVKANPNGTKTYTTTNVAAPSLTPSEEAALAQAPTPPPSLATSPAFSRVVDDVSQKGLLNSQPRGTRVNLPKTLTERLEKSANQRDLIVSQGVTEIVKIARVFPNRFLTPFTCAEVVTTDEAVDHDVRGGVVTIATSVDRPVGIFIQECTTDRAIGLTLVPDEIAQRELRLVLDSNWAPPTLFNAPSKTTDSAPQVPYIEYLKNTMKSLAQGELPAGHVLATLRPDLTPECRIPGISAELGQLLEGQSDRIAVYKLRNASRSPAPVQEQGCYMDGVLAVASFPKATLLPNEETELYIIMKKEIILPSNSAMRRPSLIGGARE